MTRIEQAMKRAVRSKHRMECPVCGRFKINMVVKDLDVHACSTTCLKHEIAESLSFDEQDDRLVGYSVTTGEPIYR